MSNPISIDGKAYAWAFQWLESSGVKPGQWVVTVSCGLPFSYNFAAIVDDFGNLVRVKEQS